MYSRDRLLALLPQLYAAPGTNTGWLVFLDGVRLAFGATAAHFFSYSLTARESSFGQDATVGATTLDTGQQREYLERWAKLDPWVENTVTTTLATGCVAVGDQLVPRRSLERTAFFNDFSRRIDVEHMALNITEREPHVVSALSVNASRRRGPFSGDDVGLLAALSPHLQRALQVHRRLAAPQAVAADLTTLIDCSGHAVFLATAEGALVFMNRAASELIADHDGLSDDGGELRAADPASTARLRAAIAVAARTSAGEGLQAGGRMLLGRPSGRRALLAVVSPLSSRRAAIPGTRTAAAMIVVTDPERSARVPDAATLQALLQLTPAEARLTRLLACGASLDAAASRLGIRTATARNYLKAIFEKTSTRRQAELTHLVHSLS